MRDEQRYRAAERRLWESVGARPTERWVPLGDAGRTVRVQELGEGTPVVFVHGTTSAGASWAHLVARLSGFRCIVPDRPGCGLSERPAGRIGSIGQFQAFADRLLVDLLDGLGLASTHVISTSLGGYFAFRAAARCGHRFGRIVEMGWPFGAPLSTVPVLMRVAALPLVGRISARAPVNARFLRVLLHQIGLGGALESGRFDQPSFDWYLSLLRDTETRRNEYAIAPKLALPLKGLNERVLLTDDELAAIENPVYFLWGRHDPFGGEETARRFVGRLPHAELEIMKDGGHAPWIDDPDRAATVVTTHLAG